MAKPYSQDLRDRLVLAVLSGQSRRNVARRFDVSPSCVIKLMQQRETTGDCLPRKFGGHKRHALAEHEDKVRALVAAQPDLTITALWKKLTALKIKVGQSAVGRFLLHLKLTYKKTLHATEQQRPDVQAARLAWREMQKGLDPKRLVFIDETWASVRQGVRLAGPRASNDEQRRARRCVILPDAMLDSPPLFTIEFFEIGDGHRLRISLEGGGPGNHLSRQVRNTSAVAIGSELPAASPGAAPRA
jgi:transposase